MENMTTRYPGFIDEFKVLEVEGPEDDKCALKVLVQREVALLAFAKHEVAGDANSLTLVRAFLADSQISTPREVAP